jgi:ABC-2 type transport system ATP-binding protein
LIRALAPKPELLVLDEPMSGLDPLAQHEFLQVITKDVAPEGRSVFFSTHNIADVEAVAQYVAIEYEGKIQTCGTIDEVCRQILKIQIPASELTSLKDYVVLEEADSNVTILIHADHSEIAATSENATPHLEPTLKDAFIFFCSGGERK